MINGLNMNNRITRRELFRRLAKILPVFALAIVPTVPAIASEAMDCKGGCTGTCIGLCHVGCTAMCHMGCETTCRESCHNTCKGSCRVSGKCDACSDICKGGCRGSCHATCQNMATGKDTIKFRR